MVTKKDLLSCNKEDLVNTILELLNKSGVQLTVEEDEPVKTTTKRKRGGKKHKKQNVTTQQETTKSRKKEGRREQFRVNPNRPNEFLNIKKEAEKSIPKNELKEHLSTKYSHKKSNSRPSPLIKVSCRICGREFEVNRATVYDAKRWKCNEHAAQSG